MATYTIRASVNAPIEVVFDVLTDHRRYAEFTPLRSSTLEREGTPPPNGVGAVRVLELVGPPLREEVTLYEPPRLFGYRLLSGLPSRTHLGQVELSENGQRTLMSYRVDTSPSIPLPSFLWSAATWPGIKMLIRGIVRESERRARSSG